MIPMTALSQTPLHDWHVAHGAKMVDFAGWSMPIQYSSIVEEHQATRCSAGLFDISHMGRFHVVGASAALFLDSICTRCVTRMKGGQIRYSLVCNEKGGILDDVLVYCLTDERAKDETEHFSLVVNASNREKIYDWLVDQNHGENKVDLKDTTLDTAMLAIQGPEAVALVDPLVECDFRAMRNYSGVNTRFGSKACYLSRTGYTGEDGCEIICDAEDALEIWERLFVAVEKVGGKACGLAARDTLRLEAAMPLYGHELSEAINPIQAGLFQFAVNLGERDFVGCEALERFAQDRSQPIRIGLQLDGRRVAREGCPILQGEESVGEVTSGTFSPTFDRPIAMGYVRPTASAIGTHLAVDIRGRQHSAVVVPLPFYERGKK